MSIFSDGGGGGIFFKKNFWDIDIAYTPQNKFIIYKH